MSGKYKVRMFESVEGDSRLDPGTIAIPIDRSFTVYAQSAAEVEAKIKNDVAAGKLGAGRVYQICPQLGNGELIRSMAVGEGGAAQRVFLDPANGLYSEFRRIRYSEAETREMVEA